MSDCLFCKIVAGELDANVIYEDDGVLAFEDIAPQAPVHVLIIPKTHIAGVNDLAESDVDVIGRLVVCAKRLAREHAIADSGYRLVVNCNADGGQTVFHLHMHLMGGKPLGALG